MVDLSHLDSKYFIDETVYNCPFCNRRSVAYSVCSQNAFGWTDRETCYIYRVQCHSCYGISMHLSFEEIALSQAFRGSQFAPFQFIIKDGEDLDSKFFYSVPTSFLGMDNKIPKYLSLYIPVVALVEAKDW